MGLLIDGAMQQAPQLVRQSMLVTIDENAGCNAAY
jgi:hypothetical protein